jgi:hypothetical protein
VQTLREADRKPTKEESRFLDDTIDDRSPTPESQEQETGDVSLPSSPSPPPTYLGVDGNKYREGTLNLMATAPSHLRKSSDDDILAQFFGTEQLTKLNMFKKQISCDNILEVTKDSHSGGDGLPLITEEGLRPGVSMPNISHPPPSSLLSYPEARNKAGQVKLRLAKNDNRLSDANRMSYDVASEMEQLRARLQETAKQELAEFDRKYSPKLLHANMMAAEGSHSRQGSLDSSITHQQVATPPFADLKSQGHSRQHSLPIDPKFLRQLQSQQSSDTTPNLATTYKSGRSPSLGGRGNLVADRDQSPPLLFGHIRQISGGSMSSEGGAFSPPLTPTDNLTTQNTQSFRSSPRSGGVQHLKQNPPGMARIGSDGAYNRERPYAGSNNSLSRSPPEGDGNRSRPNANPHYSTSVVKRGNKRGSLDMATPSSVPHPQYGTSGVIGGMYKYDERVPSGRPNAYEQPKRRSYGEDALDPSNHPRVGNGNVGRYSQVSPPRMEGNIPSSPKLSRLADRRASSTSTSSNGRQQQPSGNTAPNSRLQSRASEPFNIRGKTSGHTQEEIEPYMTSNHVKAQMQNFNYTPFNQQKQRAFTVSSASDAPKLTKQPKPSKNTWI